jgi:tetratricopeptide (TPR) repeat protein
MHAGDLAAAVEWLTEARRRHEQARQPERCCGVLGDLAGTLNQLGNRSRAEQIYREAIDLCRRFADDPNLSRWSQNLAQLSAARCDRPQARALYDQGLQAAQRSGNRYQLSAAWGNLGHFHTEDGRYAEALAAFNEALNYADRPEMADIWRGNRVEATRRWTATLLEAGDLDAAERVVRQVTETPGWASAEKQIMAGM